MSNEVPLRTRDIASVTEQQPFAHKTGRALMTMLSEANSMKLETISREEWNQSTLDSIVSKGKAGTATRLRVPSDLQLWEVGKVVKALDRSSGEKNPEQQQDGSVKIQELGRLLEDVSIYIQGRLDPVRQINNSFYSKIAQGERKQKVDGANQIAQTLGSELGSYGAKLSSDGESTRIEKRRLSQEETLRVDIFLATGEIISVDETRAFLTYLALGDQDPGRDNPAFYNLATNLGKNSVLVSAARRGVFAEGSVPSDVEQYRNEKLAQFCRVAEKSDSFDAKALKAVQRVVEAPKRALVESLFHRGMENLKESLGFERMKQELLALEALGDIAKVRADTIAEMPEVQWLLSMIEGYREGTVKADFIKNVIAKRRSDLQDVFETVLAWQEGEQTLRDAIGIDELKEELKKARDMQQKLLVEARAAERIRKAISAFPYTQTTYTANNVLLRDESNCIAATTTAGAFMKELGLTVLAGGVPNHSVLAWIPSDQETIELFNFRRDPRVSGTQTLEIMPDVIQGAKPDGSNLTFADIIAFSQAPSNHGLIFEVAGKGYRRVFEWIKPGDRQYLSVFPLDAGIALQVLNFSAALNYEQVLEQALEGKSKRMLLEDALEKLEQARSFRPKDVDVYRNLGDVLFELGRYEEATTAYREGLVFIPQDPDLYNALAVTLLSFARTKPHGSEEERSLLRQARETYKSFVALSGGQTDNEFVPAAKETIRDIEEELGNQK